MTTNEILNSNLNLYRVCLKFELIIAKGVSAIRKINTRHKIFMLIETYMNIRNI